MNALLYLDTLDLVTFESDLEYKLARSVANKIARPYLALGKRDRKGRKIWTAFDTHYFDPVSHSQILATYSRS